MKFKSIITLLTLIGLTCISTMSVYALPSDNGFEDESTSYAIVSDVEDIILSDISDIQSLAEDVGMGITSFGDSATEILSPNEA